MFKSVETCVERYLHLSRIYSEVKDVHHIFSTFKSVETCVERYLHLTHIYLEVKNAHPIYFTSKSKDLYQKNFYSSYRWTFIQNLINESSFPISPVDGHTFKILQMDHQFFYFFCSFHSSHRWTYIQILPMVHFHSSYWWTCVYILPIDFLHLPYR